MSENSPKLVIGCSEDKLVFDVYANDESTYFSFELPVSYSSSIIQRLEYIQAFLADNADSRGELK